MIILCVTQCSHGGVAAFYETGKVACSCCLLFPGIAGGCVLGILSLFMKLAWLLVLVVYFFQVLMDVVFLALYHFSPGVDERWGDPWA